ncbi:MAG TPA: serine hydrolase domain-containing protein [Ktedonobacterales bacterium]|nr:serine hydrolase domain-containing protein [Ktedonobacterales bacterium]
MEGKHVTISGHAEPGFEGVADAFAENFISRNELGAACTMYVDGTEVVDLWGGVRNLKTGEPWERGTMVIVWSASKGMSGLAVALAASRGLLNYDERVSMYWPEFAQHGKETITVRQLLSHQAGLFALDAPVDKTVLANLDRLAVILAQQKPAWAPGERQAYSMLCLGFYESELIRRVDPLHRSLGQFFQDEIASPLGLDFYIRLPNDIPNARLASIEEANPLLAFRHLNRIPLRLALAFLNPYSPLRRSDRNPPTSVSLDHSCVYARNLEVPAGGGVGTARALARAYGVFATGGRELGLRQETLHALMAPARPPARGFFDECLKLDWQLSLGFAKPSSGPGEHGGHGLDFGSPSAFGMPGWGGTFAYADPEVRAGYAYVTNQMGIPGADPREVAIRTAFHRALKRRRTSAAAIAGAA